MTKLKCLTSAPARLSVAMPLIFGLATIAAAPTVKAVGVNQVDIMDGSVDVNESGAITAADALSDFALWCDGAAAVKLDIINGLVDVNEDGSITTSDNLSNCDLTDEISGVPSRDRVDIKAGFVDVTEDSVGPADDLTNVILFDLP